MKMSLVSVGGSWFSGIGTNWKKRLYMKTWHNSKIFVNFGTFFCVIFLAPYFLIPPNHVLLNTTIIGKDSQRISKIEPFMDKHEWRRIN